jgi:o-succinylbenzoate---CoA ligase
LKNSQFHKSFALNGKSFSSVNELLVESKLISESIHAFFNAWFSDKTYIMASTSGSTGAPKSIKLAKASMEASAKATGEYFNLKPDTTALLCMSTDYIGGKMMLVRALIWGWKLDVQSPVSNPLEHTNKTYDFAAMVPMQLHQSLSNIHQIKKLLVGGGVVSESLVAEIQSVPTKIYASYGMTETVSHIAVKALNHIKGDLASYFKTLPNIKVSVDKRDCLIIKAPSLSKKAVITNDVVRLISEESFEWLGRFDHVINSGGIKIHPEIIEKALGKFIEQRFFVAGIPDAVLGEKLVLLIEGAKDLLLERRIMEELPLSKYERPKAFYWLASFKETGTKKIQRKATLDLIVYKSNK